MGIYVKFTITTHQIWSCHVTLASNSENFYFSPNSISNFGKSYQIWGNWLKNKKVTFNKHIGGGKHPSPPPPSAYRVNNELSCILINFNQYLITEVDHIHLILMLSGHFGSHQTQIYRIVSVFFHLLSPFRAPDFSAIEKS